MIGIAAFCAIGFVPPKCGVSAPAAWLTAAIFPQRAPWFCPAQPARLRPSMIRAIHLRKSAIYLCVAGALAFAVPFAARAQSPVDAFVTKVSDGIAGIHAQAGGDAAKTLAGCSDFLARVLDLPAMAKTAARDGWERMSA